MVSDLKDGETLDVLGGNRLFLIQPKDGYRFSIDSLLLWGFLRPAPRSHWVDLGTGCGILAISLAKINRVKHVTAMEIQPSLANLTRRNVELNGVTSQVTLLESDLRNQNALSKIPPAEGVCANPPYYKFFSGRINPNQEKALSRHEISGTLNDFVKAGSRLLGKGGCYITILPVARLEEALTLFARFRLFPARMRFVHAYEDQPATHVLIDALKEKQGVPIVYPPVVLYQSPNIYTTEVENLMQFVPLKYP